MNMVSTIRQTSQSSHNFFSRFSLSFFCEQYVSLYLFFSSSIFIRLFIKSLHIFICLFISIFISIHIYIYSLYFALSNLILCPRRPFSCSSFSRGHRLLFRKSFPDFIVQVYGQAISRLPRFPLIAIQCSQFLLGCVGLMFQTLEENMCEILVPTQQPAGCISGLETRGARCVDASLAR